MKKQLFSVFPRKIGENITMYYYSVYDERGCRKQFSTGKRTRHEAYEECLRLLRENRLLRKSQADFDKYTQVWFDYEKCPYIQAKLSRGFTYSRSFALQQRHFIVSCAQPYFKGKRIDAITAGDIEGFLQTLKGRGYSNTTINHHLKTVKTIFKDAFKKNVISYDPCQAILLFKNDTREKGVFTSQEVSRLFNPATVQKIWGEMTFYVMNYLAYCTGMRLGEIQALQKDAIKDGYIIVRHSWDRKYGLKGTKTGKERRIPLAKDVKSVIINYSKYVFGGYIFSGNGGLSPIRHEAIYKNFYAAAEAVGIGRQQMRERNITFHSWRHLFATRLAENNFPDVFIRELTGHSSADMQRHYTHIRPEELTESFAI